MTSRPIASAACLAGVLIALAAGRAAAQDHGGHGGPSEPISTPAHDHAAMGDGLMTHAMPGLLGDGALSREGSGTSWQPEATPMEALHDVRGNWALMLHGFANAVHDRQTGRRGDTKTFTQSMLMGMASRPLGPGRLGLRSMVSADPTMGKRGYPLLFQTGESADGKTALIDRQHPHDALMELSASYSLALAAGSSAYVYAGLPGEPALGPSTFMHRYSGQRNPEAPLMHHWFDSTHITFGVLTVGASRGPWKLEGSWFNGREPDEKRWNIETRRFDSWSSRLSWNPGPAWSLQTSYGYLKSPEQLEPDTSVRRVTASASWHARPAGADWATTLAWARNDKRGPEGRVLLPGVLLESTWVAGRHTVFGRYERVKKDELFGEGELLHGAAFTVAKVSLGTIYDIVATGPVRWGLGAVVGRPRGSSRLDAAYGSRPMSYMVFLQARLGPMQ